jgi:hypothetical protein
MTRDPIYNKFYLNVQVFVARIAGQSYGAPLLNGKEDEGRPGALLNRDAQRWRRGLFDIVKRDPP